MSLGVPWRGGPREEPAQARVAGLSPFRQEIQESQVPRAWSSRGKRYEPQAATPLWSYEVQVDLWVV